MKYELIIKPWFYQPFYNRWRQWEAHDCTNIWILFTMMENDTFHTSCSSLIVHVTSSTAWAKGQISVKSMTNYGKGTSIKSFYN